jgi:hypothetical protein
MAHAAEKLNGFYSGSGGISADVHRVLLIKFAADGSAIPSAEVAHKRSPNLARPPLGCRQNITVTERSLLKPDQFGRPASQALEQLLSL